MEETFTEDKLRGLFERDNAFYSALKK